MALPAINSSIMLNKRGFLAIWLVKAVINGPPIATPKAYKVTSDPALEIEMDRSLAMVGKSPIITTSVVPMANTLMVSAHKAIGIFEFCIVQNSCAGRSW